MIVVLTLLFKNKIPFDQIKKPQIILLINLKN